MFRGLIEVVTLEYCVVLIVDDHNRFTEKLQRLKDWKTEKLKNWKLENCENLNSCHSHTEPSDWWFISTFDITLYLRIERCIKPHKSWIWIHPQRTAVVCGRNPAQGKKAQLAHCQSINQSAQTTNNTQIPNDEWKRWKAVASWIVILYTVCLVSNVH